MIRAFLAGLFVFGCMLGAAVLIGGSQPSGTWSWWATPAIILVMFTAVFFSLQVFNPKGQRLSDAGKPIEQRISELDSAGLVTHQKFSAFRCFGVEEFEDEGPSYYIELADHRVLFLSGQYLYEYEETTDDPELNQPRRFPCEEFEILRHKSEGYVISIACGGKVLVPELTTPPFSRHDFKSGVPEDGDILTNRTFDQLKAEKTGTPQTRG